jgi:hypothetical protein
MRVICINDLLSVEGVFTRVKIGKVYNVIEENLGRYLIIDDFGYKVHLLKNRFITIEELRNNKIEEILK